MRLARYSRFPAPPTWPVERDNDGLYVNMRRTSKGTCDAVSIGILVASGTVYGEGDSVSMDILRPVKHDHDGTAGLSLSEMHPSVDDTEECRV